MPNFSLHYLEKGRSLNRATMQKLPCKSCHAKAAMRKLPCKSCHAKAAMQKLPCESCHAFADICIKPIEHVAGRENESSPK
ncbi:hypothetical protein POVWA1_023430 [Plasmodium ovale wallikeri]|uniref:Uncharacterized protein n=1 Tax=Plasmodium ovale wallikeri TaxID=864142 RepID=A0A1A8YSP8_PLAOA|nr:hypothetical protein POVWA1_023430 [Plasmodium ovale wallikeri]